MQSKLLTSFGLVLLTAHLQGHGPRAQSERETLVMDQQLAHMQSSDLKATVIRVHYGPDEHSMAHNHGCPVIGYVLHGTLRTQMKGQPVEYYSAGRSLYEPPNETHMISENASHTKPAEFLAFFICEPGAQLNGPMKENSK
jgi:quercetin dioxygenase-like cupin family protein